MRFAVLALAIAAATPASAATLLTSNIGYIGPVMTIPVPGYLFTGGPLSLGSGITFTSTSTFSAVGNGEYGLNANGDALNRPIIGSNDSSSVMTLTFATPVAAFGADMNYATFIDGTPDGDDPVIAAYDSMGGLIASFNLASLAPISTPFAIDGFQFRGIDGGGIPIASFTLSGAYIIAGGQPAAAVPEPASWAMLVAGFGLAGAVARRRRRVVAA